MHRTIRSVSPFILVLLWASCSIKKNEQLTGTSSSELLEKLYQKDVEIRELDAKTDTVNLENYDKKHRAQVFQLLAENKVISPKDKIRAAWILQHTVAQYCDGKLTSMSPENFLLAYKLSSSALSMLEKENDTATIRRYSIPRIVALNYDRYLLYTLGYQKFGTQFIFDDQSQEMILAPIDTTLCNDNERKKHNVEPLQVLLSTNKMKPMPSK